MILVNSVHKHFPKVAPIDRGLYITGGTWTKLPTRIIEQLSNEQLFCFGKKIMQENLNMHKNLSLVKFISSMIMYSICSISSWNNDRAFPCNDYMSFIGIWSPACIVVSCMLNIATLVGVRRSSGLWSKVAWEYIVFLMVLIR